ncbi:MAG: hypothetical protein FWD28_01070 [Treponema sp.]|nr:hypothetical protein [Treponema sp.]
MKIKNVNNALNLFICLFIFCLLFSCGKDKNSEIDGSELSWSDLSWEERLENASEYYRSMPYGMLFDEIDLSSMEIAQRDFSLINFINAEIITQYSFPDIINVPTSPGDGVLPDSPVSVSYLTRTWSGFYIIFKKDIDLEKEITLIAKGGTNEYVYQNEINPIRITNYIDPANYLGYFFEIVFEHKPWLNNDTNSDSWQFIVKSGDEELINENLSFDFSYMLFDNLTDTPFTVSNLLAVDQNKEYTYRFRTRDADLLTLYIYHEFMEPFYATIYRPIIYLKPISNSGVYTDIKISWNNPQLAGIYHIGRHRIERLPAKELMIPVFDSIVVR